MLSCYYACFYGLRVTENFQDLGKAPGWLRGEAL